MLHGGSRSCVDCEALRECFRYPERNRRRFYYPATTCHLRKAIDWKAANDIIERYGLNINMHPENDEASYGEHGIEVPEFREQVEILGPVGQQHVNGIYGVSVVAILDENMFLRMLHADPMHFIWLHVIPELVCLWTDADFAGAAWSVRSELHNLNRLLSITTPPHGRQELPKDLSEAKSWKAATARFFTLYLALPVLKHTLKEPYYTHFSSLVRVLRYLCGPVIHEVNPAAELDLVTCESKLKDWVRHLSDLYGKQHVSLSMHMLLHLCPAVRDVGPLWASNCFAFESANHWLVRTMHAKRYGQAQSLYDAFTRFVICKEFIDSYVRPENEQFCNWLFDRGYAPFGYKKSKLYVFFNMNLL